MKDPTPTDAAYIARLRKDYPERCAGLSDVQVQTNYNPCGHKYVECTLWDHLGDAADDYERLADAYLRLKHSLRLDTTANQSSAPSAEGQPK